MIEILIKWILFSISVGVAEGAFFAHGAYLTRWPYNIHNFLILPRIVVGAGLIWDVMPLMTWYGPFVLSFAFMGMFPFFHDGFYYTTRQLLDFPAYNFFSESDTTNSVFSFSFETRTFLLLAGFTLFAWAYMIVHGNIYPF